ncbi:hypothetical protein [Stutzerimonas balearica]|uniref:hypothetical protein n=1 Tax=Stutzerimonas balearica TaxID=74829 RepID=UPI0028B0EC27|nr:hypothetical protein [Stutzerimonas balearica]
MPGAIAVSPAGLQRTGVSKGTCVGLSRNTKARRLGRTGVATDAVDIVWPFIEGLPIQRPENLETLADGLRKAGLRA